MLPRARSLALWTALVLIALAVLGVALPLVLPLALNGATALREAFRSETTGLIFVESPEVYTRQRLVNDRYLQDAWLRQKLDEIDARDSLFIDSRHLLESYVEARVALNQMAADGAAPAAEPPAAAAAGAAPGPLPEGDQVPFSTKFTLQAAARDKIRQLILENALDDRHDLSGNTVFGLKFDTSVIPGPNTRLNPTVIVRMAANPLSNLSSADSASLAAQFVKSADARGGAGLSAAQQAETQVAAQFSEYFDRWRINLMQRILQQKAEGDANAWVGCLPPAAGGTSVPVPVPVLDQPLCAGPGDLSPDARKALDTFFYQRRTVENAVAYVLRLPDAQTTIGARFLDGILSLAEQQCVPPQPGAATPALSVRDFLTPQSASGLAPQRTLHLPLPWGELFELSISHSPPEGDYACPADLDVSLLGLEVEMNFFQDTARGDVLTGAGWTPVVCNAEPCTAAGLSPWLRLPDPSQERKDVILKYLDNDAMGAVLAGMQGPGASPATGASTCFAKWREGDPWYNFGQPIEGADEQVCFNAMPGSYFFRIGAFNFLKRMSRVESYTYAAFPKGDVTGVVTETVSGAEAELGVSPIPEIGSGRLAASERERSATAEAIPSVINFASGQSTRPNEAGRQFDFGWSIVKQGRMKPMIASQLVLVSVPAYLDELTLETWQGFLDISRLPLDRTGKSYNDLTLEERLDRLLSSYENRTIRVEIPPDYSALDGIMAEAGLTSGPVIDQDRLPAETVIRCDGSLSLVIPGERLWRSTVVTLDGTRATKIEVMPDMRGIIATFGRGSYDPGQPGGGIRSLEVWTSEGHHAVRRKITFVPESTRCQAEAAATQAAGSAADLAGDTATAR